MLGDGWMEEGLDSVHLKKTMRTFLHERLLALHCLICCLLPRTVFTCKRLLDVFLVLFNDLSDGTDRQFCGHHFKVELLEEHSFLFQVCCTTLCPWNSTQLSMRLCNFNFYFTLILCTLTPLFWLKWVIQYIFALLHWLYEQPSSVMRLVAFQAQQCLFIGQERLFVSGGSVARGLFFTGGLLAPINVPCRTSASVFHLKNGVVPAVLWTYFYKLSWCLYSQHLWMRT